MSKYSVILNDAADTTCIVELGQPEAQILVDGKPIGRQNADGSCRVGDCIRLALRTAYDRPIYETAEYAAGATHDCIIWEDVAYASIGD